MTEQLTLDVRLSDLDEPEARVLSVLRAHRGRARAIKARELAIQASVAGTCVHRASPRMVQLIVNRLRREHGVSIASTATEPAGYYLIETVEELKQFKHEQKAKALGILVAIAAVDRIALPELLGQLAIEVAA